MRQMAPDLGRRDCRTVAGEDRIRRDQLFDFREDLLFQRQLLRRRFEDEGRILQGRGKRVMGRDAADQRRIVVEKIGDRVQSLRQRCAKLGGRLEERDV